jgi:hypothetical protein
MTFYDRPCRICGSENHGTGGHAPLTRAYREALQERIGLLELQELGRMWDFVTGVLAARPALEDLDRRELEDKGSFEATQSEVVQREAES